MTGNDVTLPHVTISDPEVTSFHRKSPVSGCRTPISQVLGTSELPQGCNSQVLSHVTGNDVIRPHVTGGDPEGTLLSGNHLEVVVEGL